MNHYTLTVRLAHIAATVAAMVVSIGAAIGFHEMTGSWPLAILAGAGIASVLALGWWSLITAASRARRPGSKAGVITLGVLLVAVALGTSGWALATAIGGSSALAAHNRLQVEAHELALNTAYGRVTGQSGVIDAIATAETAYSGYAEAESSGDLGNGSGCGPRCRTYERAGQTLSSVRGELEGQLSQASDLRMLGVAALNDARASKDPSDALTAVSAVVASLNAIDLDAGQVGIVNFTAGADGVIDVDKEGLTQAIIDADRELPAPIVVPSYEALTAAEATVRYADRVAGAWIAAVAIDIAPLLMLLMVMLLSSEPLLRESVTPRRKVTDDEIRTREEDLGGNVRRIAE